MPTKPIPLCTTVLPAITSRLATSARVGMGASLDAFHPYLTGVLGQAGR